MKKFIVTLFLILGLSIGSLFVTSVVYACDNGWYTDTRSNQWYYYKYGTRVCGDWINYGGKWYYFDDNGVMLSGITKEMGDKIYIFSHDGSMNTQYGWIKISNGFNTSYLWYYGNGDGTVKTQGWVYSNGEWYYFNYLGVMVCNDTEIVGDKAYLFSENGAMNAKQGWISVFNDLHNYYEWYYGNGDGTVKVGEWLYENGNSYYFRKLNSRVHGHGSICGIMVSNGTEEIDKKTYLFDSNGCVEYRSGWIDCGYNDYVYGNGDGTVKVGEWYCEDGKWYYFTKKQEGHRKDEHGYPYFYYYFGGQMLRDVSENVDGKIYTFDFNGVCINP